MHANVPVVSLRKMALVSDVAGAAGTPASKPSAQAVLISLGGAFLTMAWGLAGLIALPSYRLAQRDLSKVAS